MATVDLSNPDLSSGPPKPVTVNAIRKFTCPGCGGEINVRALGHTLSAVCAHCGSVIDVSDERLQVIQQVSTKTRETLLDIGQRGSLDGIKWEVIGYVLKSDKTKQYFWDEYLLFNPYHGFRFLVQQDGHWNFVRMVKADFQRLGFSSTVWLDDHEFAPFLRDAPIVQYVKGEFYWRIQKGDSATTEDYVSPPYMLSFEISQGEEVASLCTYKMPGEIKDAFSVTKPMPARKGVAPNQPANVNLAAIVKTAAVAICLALLLHIVNASSSASQTIASVGATFQPGDQTRVFAGDPFEIPAQSNVLVMAQAPVSNSWVELNLSLVNEDTKEVFEVTEPIEYYYGSDSDGPWSEGSTTADGYLSAVPAGKYRLVYDVEAEALTRNQPQPVTVILKRDVASWGNFGWTLLLLLFYPGFAWLRYSSFETKRWENSDFPRSSGGDE